MADQKQLDRLTLQLDSAGKLRSGGLSALISQLVKPDPVITAQISGERSESD